MPRARWATISLLLLFLPLSCGDDDSGNHQDGGQPGVHALVILTPPGPSIGLAPGESVVLRVSYLDPQDRPVPNVQVGFAIQGSAQGATLGGFHGYTDASGTAEMLLTAASVPARFTVNVTAPQALPVFFEVAVSTAGFTSLEVQPSYRGSHSLSDFGSLMAEVRFDLSCTDVHPLGDFPADRERVIDGFNGLALFQNLPVDLSYAVAVRALGVDGRTLAWSCSDLISGQLLREATMRLHLLLEDLETSASGRYSLLTRLELPAGSQSELRAYFSAFLPAADCSHALEQLLLDCILDAAFPDGAADCSINSTDPSVVDIEALRGVKDAQGCRGTDTVGGQPSLELELRESMDATGAERVAALLTFLSTPSADISGLQIRSELSIAENPATKDIYSWHALKSVCLPGINPDLWFPLADLGAVPLSVASLPSSRSEGTPTFVTIPPHGL
ncbi:MAG: Ig-like domain-containing protein, partial [Polyangia bacterium]|nr:Ig-like domain-containing protein [Polyangia bacterium]